MLICSKYRPSRGKFRVEILTELLTRNDNSNKEIWLLGEFNIDYLDHANQNIDTFNVLFKKYGMHLFLLEPTRPEDYRNSCINTYLYWIVSNSLFYLRLLFLIL